MSDLRDLDALECYKYRYRFQDHGFMGMQWNALEAAGCRYIGGTYSYQNHKFSSARNLQECLDQFAVPNINSWDQGVDEYNTDTNYADLWELRVSACFHLRKMIEDHEDKCGNSNVDSGNTAVEAPPEKAVVVQRRSSKRLAAASVTAQAGSDLYLRRKSARVAKNKNEETTEAAVEFPTMAQTIDFMKRNVDTSYCTSQEKEYQTHFFSRWRDLLLAHQPILYGYGSKRQLLEDFCDSVLTRVGYVLQIHVDSTVTVESILELKVALVVG